MSEKSGTACSVCRRGTAKWMCKCANEAICADGICRAIHTSKAGRAHALVEYEVGVQVPSEMAAACSQNFDRAVEVAEYLSGEVQWLTSEKNRLEAEIDRQMEVYIAQIRRLGFEKKKELNQLLLTRIKSIESYKTAESTELILTLKQARKHIEELGCIFNELAIDSLVSFHNVGGIEKVYQFAKECTNSWSFSGPIDALSIQVSKHILLKGLGLPKRNNSTPLSLHLLQVLKGGSTVGEVIYSDAETRNMNSSHPHLVKVMLKRAVPLLPNTLYTLKVQMQGGSGYSISTVMPALQDGLSITTLETAFGRSEQDNGSCPEQGIFFELYYS